MEKLALTNPLSVILNKSHYDFCRKDFLKIIPEKGIERITFHYTGLDGHLKELKIPISSIEHAERVLAQGERVDGSSIFKGMVDASLSDLYVVPLYRTAFLNPFEENSLDFMCRYLTKDGELAPFGLDNILENAYSHFQEKTDLKLNALGELEFFLIRSFPETYFPGTSQKNYHVSSPFFKNSEILNEMLKTIASITGAVKYGHSEVGFIESIRSDLPSIKGKTAEQVEIEFLPRPINEMGDFLVLSKWIIRNIAKKHGAVVSFAPKLEEGVAGNGFHVHLELEKDGKNIMRKENGELSDEALKLIAGLSAYADSLTAFGNTVSSAYLRLVPNQEAPTKICWSDRNRSAMIRIPLGWSKMDDLSEKINPSVNEPYKDDFGKQTVELRSPDGSAIIHLLLAGITMAVEHGFTMPNAIEFAQKHYITGNIFKNRKLLKSLKSLPTSCVESSKILLKNRELYERDNIFPPSVINYVANLLAKENDLHMNEELADMPADDRLHKTRKIMHKDLHKH